MRRPPRLQAIEAGFDRLPSDAFLFRCEGGIEREPCGTDLLMEGCILLANGVAERSDCGEIRLGLGKFGL